MVLSPLLHVGHPRELPPEMPWRLGSAPVRARCGHSAAAWVAGTLGVPGTQGSWWPWEQELWCIQAVLP